MKSKILMMGLVAALAVAKCDAAPARVFVLFDPMLRMPAVCYPLDGDWVGLGQIAWNMRSDTKFFTSTILYSQARHEVVQTTGPLMIVSEVLTPQRMAEFQDPNVLAQNLAAEFNRGIIVPGLSQLTPTGGRFTQNVSSLARMSAAAYGRGTLSTVNAFGFEGRFACTFGGVPCEAVYTTSYAVSISAVPNPRIPKICNWTRCGTVFVLAPQGRIPEAVHDCGRLLASAFVNYHWVVQRERSLSALVAGTIQGRNEGWELWKQSQRATSATLDRVRKMRSELIRDVMTVDNPLSPGEKIERSAFYKNAWINSREDALLMSDNSLEPNTMRGLMEMGDRLPMQ